MKGKFLQGETLEQKMNHVDVILRRLTARPEGKTIVVVPPIPIFIYRSSVEENGFVGRWVAPVGGRVTEIHVYAGMVVDKAKPTMTVEVAGEKQARTASAAYKGGVNSAEVVLDVAKGERLQISTSLPESVGDLSVSLLFEITNTRDLLRQKVAAEVQEETE